MFRRFRIGIFLAFRQIKNSNGWVNFLIILIMTATFLNLVFVSGILEGLVAGASQELREGYSGDLIITPADDRIDIVSTTELVDRIRERSDILSYSVRRISNVRLEKDLREPQGVNVKDNAVSAQLVGIDMSNEDRVTDLSDFLVEGRYPGRDISRRKILLGSGLLEQYEAAIGDQTLKEVEAGSRVKLSVGEQSREYVVGGILEAKISEINNRVFIDDREFISFPGTSFRESNEISLAVQPEAAASV